MSELKVAIAQCNLLVGAIEENASKVITLAKKSRDEQKADIIVFPELTLIGYPPDDLLLRDGLYARLQAALTQIKTSVDDIAIVIGMPQRTANSRYNAALLIHNGNILGEYYKQQLPNYGVFDELRYFEPGSKTCVIDFKGFKVALAICEDLWHPWQMNQAKLSGADLILHLNASPFHQEKQQAREAMMRNMARKNQLPIIYVNHVGGQDELVFDGGSMAINSQGDICVQAPFFKTATTLVKCYKNQDNYLRIEPQLTPPVPKILDATYQALVLGLQDYIIKNKFQGVLLGLSGGIDSALTLAIAHDALGSENVTAVRLPSKHTTDMSMTDAQQLATTLNIQLKTLPIQPLYENCLETLQTEFSGKPIDVTEENIQARLRSILLMALSNKNGQLLLSTGNKSELAVGYSTLYGDMAGGFSLLKDVTKTSVYALANYRNQLSPVIPNRIITRPPSAELRDNQTDQDTLPPYAVLDDIITRYIEKDETPQHMMGQGYNADMVNDIVSRINRNEYKRRQGALGIKITSRAFGRDRRYPITEGYTRSVEA